MQTLFQPTAVTLVEAAYNMAQDIQGDQVVPADETQEPDRKRARVDHIDQPIEGLITDHDKLGKPLLSGATSMKTQLYQLRSLMWMLCKPYMLHAGNINRVTGQGFYKLNTVPGTGSVAQPVHVWEVNRQISPYTNNIGYYMRHDGNFSSIGSDSSLELYDFFGNRSLGTSYKEPDALAMLESVKICLNFRGRTDRPTKYTVKLVTEFSPFNQPDNDAGAGSDPEENTWELYVKNLLGKLTYNPIVSHYTHKPAFRNPFKTLYHKDIYIGENKNGQDAQMSRPLTINYGVNKLTDFWHWKHGNSMTVDNDHGTTQQIPEFDGTVQQSPSTRASPMQRIFLMVYATDYKNTSTNTDAPSYDMRMYTKWLSPAHAQFKQ